MALLRDIAKPPRSDDICVISAADPLNLVGVITPGVKVPALPGNRILYRGGVPTALLTGNETTLLGPVDEGDVWALKNQLTQGVAPPQLRAYL